MVAPGLWIEMTDRDPEAYAAERVDEVLEHPDVRRATWWRNLNRDRDDLPRELPEFSLLGVYEVGLHFERQRAPDDVTGYHYIHTSRPSQGVLTGRPTVGLSLVLISPQEPSEAQALRDWADFVHIHEIAAATVPGITTITPYRSASADAPTFLHLYEMDTEDAEATFQSMSPLVAERIGGRETDAWRQWATCPELRIMYVNSFARLGIRTRTS